MFDPKNIHILESKERRSYLNPNQVLSLVNLKSSYVAADLGCGSGVFTIPLSKKVKKVYAIDIEQKMLDALTQKILENKISNIKPLLSEVDQIPIEENFIDFLLTVNTLHEFRNLNKTLREIHRILKPHGKVLVIDFKKKKQKGFGPPSKYRISSRKAKIIFNKMRFKVLELKFLKLDYFLLFEKNT